MGQSGPRVAVLGDTLRGRGEHKSQGKETGDQTRKAPRETEKDRQRDINETMSYLELFVKRERARCPANTPMRV